MTTREWSFGVNDPRLSGWVITAGYFIAFFLCLWAGIDSKKTAANAASKGNGAAAGSSDGGRRGGGLWFLFAAILFLLGVNKQLDLQTLLHDIGRAVSTAQGWYHDRRVAQAVFVAFFALICGAVVILIVKRSRQRRGEYGITPVGIVLLIAVIVLRAGFMEHIHSVFLKWRAHVPRRVYAILELSCIALSGLGALIVLVRDLMNRMKESRFDGEKE